MPANPPLSLTAATAASSINPRQSHRTLPAAVSTAALRLQLIERRPTLPLRRHVLTLVLTDRTLRQRFRARGMLHAAGPADIGGHSRNLRDRRYRAIAVARHDVEPGGYVADGDEVIEPALPGPQLDESLRVESGQQN